MSNLEDIILTELKIIKDNRGQVMHMLRADSPHFQKFGEIYFSCINPGIIKGWKLHTKSTSNIAVPIGEVKFVLYDTRENSKTEGQFQEIILGENNYKLLTIPPGIAYGWKNLAKGVSFLANCASEPYSPDEAKTLTLLEIPYRW